MRNKTFGYDPDAIAGVSDNINDESLQPINGLRHLEDRYSGWFLWRGEDFKQDPDFFKPTHLKHVEDMIPVDLLSLGPGYRFLFDSKTGYRDIWYDKSLLIKDE